MYVRGRWKLCAVKWSIAAGVALTVIILLFNNNISAKPLFRLEKYRLPELRRRSSLTITETTAYSSDKRGSDDSLSISSSSAQLLQRLSDRNIRWAVFVGHSRIRQVFENLVERLDLTYVSRSDARNHVVPFQDLPLPDELQNATLTGSSTCLGARPKPVDERGRQRGVWCSHVAISRAESPALQLEFRWRNSVTNFLDLLQRFSRVCRQERVCPDVLILTQGLHFTFSDPLSQIMASFRQTVEGAVDPLRTLLVGGCQSVWMLEHGSNPLRRDVQDGLNDDMAVINTLVAEMLAFLEPSVAVWSSHLETVVDFINRQCLRPDVPLRDKDEACREDLYHTGVSARRIMAQQLLQYMIS